MQEHGGWSRQESPQGSESHTLLSDSSSRNNSKSHAGHFRRQLSPMSAGSGCDRLEAEVLRNKVRNSVSRDANPPGYENSLQADESTLQAHGVFLDVSAMKSKVRECLTKPTYNVTDLYKDKGCWPSIVRNQYFEQFTLVVIFVNAIWIAVDTDLNTADILLDAETPFQIMENAFCAFFFFELTARLLSFRATTNAFKDGWFLFDSALVLMMVLETWILCLIVFCTQSDFSGGMGNASILRTARLLRLTRMARMARLLRAMPELMVMIKGMMAAMRSVLFTLLLQVIIMYIFGVAFTQLLRETEVGARYFDIVPNSMYSLLMYGTFLDDITTLTNRIGRESPLTAFLFIVFVLIAALTVMNMLIGILCEVVSAVAATEKETMLVQWIKSKMATVLQELDTNGDNVISRNEFLRLLENGHACRALRDVGVDVVGLVDLTEAIFDCPQANKAKELTFGDFMDIILQLRGTNNATVKDIVDLRKLVNELGERTMEHFEQLTSRAARSNRACQAELQAKHELLEFLSEKDEDVVEMPSSPKVSKGKQFANGPPQTVAGIAVKHDVSDRSEDEGLPVPLKLTPVTQLMTQAAGVDSAAQWQELASASLQMCGGDLEQGNPGLEANKRILSKGTQACTEKASGRGFEAHGLIGGSCNGLPPKLSRLGEALSTFMCEFERIQEDLLQTICTDAGASARGSLASENDRTPFIHDNGW